LAHYNLGNALQEKGQLDRAIECYHKALALEPKDAKAHTNLGNALAKKGQLDRASACYEQALALDPKHATAHAGLGIALQIKGQLGQAIARYEKALAIDLKLAQAHGPLGQALLRQGRFAEARDSTRRCLQLLPQRHPMRSSVSRQLRRCERLLALDARLPTLLKGQEQPASAAEGLEYQLCWYKQRYAAAACLFAADPKRAGNIGAGQRYNAACAAALAAAGKGADAAGLGARETDRLRQQARAWLQADLSLWSKVLQARQLQPQARAAIQGTLRRWQRDPDLAGLRDEPGLAWLPEERLACRRFWADVDALLKRANDQK
jgi:tetratricopeptide (TPR) repeat protein